MLSSYASFEWHDDPQFDEYVDEIGAPNANRMSVGLQYPRRTAANYEGGSWYLRANYSF